MLLGAELFRNLLLKQKLPTQYVRPLRTTLSKPDFSSTFTNIGSPLHLASGSNKASSCLRPGSIRHYSRQSGYRGTDKVPLSTKVFWTVGGVVGGVTVTLSIAERYVYDKKIQSRAAEIIKDLDEKGYVVVGFHATFDPTTVMRDKDKSIPFSKTAASAGVWSSKTSRKAPPTHNYFISCCSTKRYLYSFRNGAG